MAEDPDSKQLGDDSQVAPASCLLSGGRLACPEIARDVLATAAETAAL